jgi:hypothetical protein
MPDAADELLANIKAALPQLDAMLQNVVQRWVPEDLMASFYTQTPKLFLLQRHTVEMQEALAAIAPNEYTLSETFTRIISRGTNLAFANTPNVDQASSQMIVEAFFHAKFMLEQAVGHGRLWDQVPSLASSGFIALQRIFSTSDHATAPSSIIS